MGYNYGYGREKMEKEFEKVAKEYRDAGVSEKWINYIHELDLESLNNERKFYRHTVFIESVKFSDDKYADESNSPLYKDHPEQFCATEVEISEWGHYDWIEDLDGSELIAWVRTLKPADVDLLTYQIQGGLLQTDIARLLKVSDAAISKRMKRLRKDLEKFLQKRLKR